MLSNLRPTPAKEIFVCCRFSEDVDNATLVKSYTSQQSTRVQQPRTRQPPVAGWQMYTLRFAQGGRPLLGGGRVV